MNNIQLTVQEINSMQPLQIAEAPQVRDKFITIWNTLWGEGTGEAAYERESNYFNNLLREKDSGKLMKATPFSIFTAFIDLAISGLSLEPGSRALTYLIGRNVNVGTKDHQQWEGRVKLTISAYGELVMRERCGQIRHADNPVIVYANDEFSFADRGGRKEVDYVCHLPHNNQPIVACYLRITRADGSTDYAVMTEEDWVRLASYSMKQNQRYDRSTGSYVGTANALYGMDQQGVVHIDTGFLMAKCIKHAFKTYPKMRIGRGTEMQTQQEDTENEMDSFYGIQQAGDDQEPQQEPKAYGEQEPQAGVNIETDPDDAF